jgi:5-methylcytosine-specific restriction endonuclease McrA
MSTKQHKTYNHNYYLSHKDKWDKCRKDWHSWFLKNKQKRKEWEKQYRKNNREKVNKWKHKSYQLNKKHYKEYRKLHEKHIREYNALYRERNKILYRELHKKYRKTIIGKCRHRLGEHKRRMLKYNSKGTFTPSDWINILNLQNCRCKYCGCILDNIIIPTIDHIIPLSKGGLHDKSNIVAACFSCNSKKGTKILNQELMKVGAQ